MRTLTWAAALILSAPFATAQDGPAAPSRGAPSEWVNVSDVLNRDALPEEAPGWFPQAFPEDHIRAGGVDHPYRIMRTLITNEQWVEFVTVYAPYWEGSPGASELTGYWINDRTVDGEVVYEIIPGAELLPASMGWHIAARYCNWLHNDRVSQAWAFESGAYDASTFTENEDGTWNSQVHHSPGARYWIPTLSEITKALYWDPNKNGGLGGYWRYPDSGDEPLIQDLPENGGETGAGLGWSGIFFPVESYPHVRSPWGLLDASGLEQQWTEMTASSNTRVLKGTNQYHEFAWFFDNVDSLSTSFPWASSGGLRVVGLSNDSCSVDLARPLGVLDTSDVILFLQLYQGNHSGADLAPPFGLLDFTDVIEFIVRFAPGSECQYAL